MSYIFNYNITAKCYRMGQCYGTPSGILSSWTKLSSVTPQFSVDQEGWLTCMDDLPVVAGFYRPGIQAATDYSFTVPVIAPQIASGGIGVCFRVYDSNNYYYFLWDQNTLGWEMKQRLVKVRGGVPQILAENAGELPSSYMQLISVELSGNRIVVMVNGQVIFDYTDAVDCISTGSYGIVAYKNKGGRFAGVYDQAVEPIDISREFSDWLEPQNDSIANSKLVNGTVARDVMYDLVAQKRSELGVEPEGLIVYAYTTRAVDPFAQTYFNTGEPVIYVQHGNYYTYAYLKNTPRVPEAPLNFRGVVDGGYIHWNWSDVTAIENGYHLYNTTGELIATLPPNTTQYSEPITDDGVTVTRRLVAYNHVGESAPVEAAVYIPATRPRPPAVFTGRATSTSTIVWVWSYTPSAQEYEILDDASDVIVRLPADATSYRETGLKQATAYTRCLRAVRNGLVSESVCATIETLGARSDITLTPYNFTGEVLSKKVARWTWEYEGKAAHFVLFDTTGDTVATVDGAERSHIEYELEPGKSYTRILVAEDGTGHRSIPVTATLVMEDDFEITPCEELPALPRYVDGFASGIGDAGDLATNLEYGEGEIVLVIQAVGEAVKETKVEEPARCEVRFLAEGTEEYEIDYGRYELEISAQPRQDVEFELTAEVYEPVSAEYHVEADVDYINCYPAEIPFEADIVGYAVNTAAPPLSDTCQVHCEADVTYGQDVPFNYQVEITYTSEDPAYKPFVDIIWLIDGSGSMEDKQQALNAYATTFVQGLNANHIDYRLGVVGYCDYPGVIYDSTANQWTTLASEFGNMVLKVGSSWGDGGTKNGMRAILFALSNYSFRQGALKYFIILTDENADDYAAYNIQTVIGTLKNNNVIFSCIYNPNDAFPYPNIATATGGIDVSIFSADWESTLDHLVNNISSKVTRTYTFGNRQNSTGALQAVAHYGSGYTEADQRTIAQIVSDFISTGQSGLPADFLTSGYNTITYYRFIPPAVNGVYTGLSVGSLTTTDGNAKIVAYSTITSTTRQTFSTSPFMITAGARCISPDMAASSSQTCGQIMDGIISAFKAGNPLVVSITPVKYWVTSGGTLKVFTSSPDGFDFVRWYRSDYDTSIVRYRARISGSLDGSHTENSPLKVSALQAGDIVAGAIPAGCEPMKEFPCFTGMGWRLGSTPFDGYKRNVYTAGVLEETPSVAYFIKDVHLTSVPSSAIIYIASDDGIALYINGTLIADRTGDTHSLHYWDYTYDITPYLTAGRNRVAVLVDNGYKNAGEAAGGFDCKLAVTIGGSTSYPILHGADNYGLDECMWWYYGLPDNVSTPPRDFSGLEWYACDYGILDLTAHRAESLTPGAVAYIDSDGSIYVYPSRSTNTCDTPVTGTWRVSSTVNNYGDSTARYYTLLEGIYGISGPGIPYNITARNICYLGGPELILQLYKESPAFWVNTVQYVVLVSGNVAVSSASPAGDSPVELITTEATYRQQTATITVRSGTITYNHLDELSSASSPQAITTETAAQILAPFINETPELKNTTYTIKSYRAVGHNTDSTVSTAADGNSPVYAYPTRPSRYYTSWRFSDSLYAHEGIKVLARTTDLQPLGKDNKPAPASSWRLTHIAVPVQTQVKWRDSDDNTVSGDGWEIIGYTSAAVAKNMVGYVTTSSPVKIIPNVVIPEANDMPSPVFVVSLNGDSNVYSRLYEADRVIFPGQSAVVVDGRANIITGASIATAEKPWKGAGQWFEANINGRARLRIDVPIPANVNPELFTFELNSSDSLEAHFYKSGGLQAADKHDELVISGKRIGTREEKGLWQGTQHWYVLPSPGDIGEERVVVIQTPSVKHDMSYDPLVHGVLRNVHYTCHTSLPGIEAVVEDVRQAPDASIDLVTVRTRVIHKTAMPWCPVSRAGFYYHRGEERYLYGSCETGSALEILEPIKTGVSLLVRGAVVTDNDPRVIDIQWWKTVESLEDIIIEDFCSHTWRVYDAAVSDRIPADGEWHAFAGRDIYTILSTFTPWFERDGGAGILELVTVEQLTSDVSIQMRYDRAGTGFIEVRTTEKKTTSINIVEVADDSTAVLYPRPVGYGPIVVLTQDGTPLRYAPFFDAKSNPSLENVEMLRGTGNDTVYLAYRDIDPASLRVQIKPTGSSNWFEVKRFQLCRQKLRLPFRLAPTDELKVQYRLKDSFSVDLGNPDGGITVFIHSERVRRGDTVSVFYETSPEELHRWAGPNLNPLFAPFGDGFLALSYEEDKPEKLTVAVKPDVIEEDSPQQVQVEVLASSGGGSPSAGKAVMVSIGNNRPIVANTNEYGRAKIWLNPPYTIGRQEIVCICGSARTTATLTVLPPVPHITVSVLPSASATYPGNELSILVRVNRNQIEEVPEIKLNTSCVYGNLSASEVVTDAFGEAVLTYISPVSEDIVDTIEVKLAGIPDIKGTALIYTSKTIGTRPQTENRWQDIPEDYNTRRLGIYDITNLSTTPPEFL